MFPSMEIIFFHRSDDIPHNMDAILPLPIVEEDAIPQQPIFLQTKGEAQRYCPSIIGFLELSY